MRTKFALAFVILGCGGSAGLVSGTAFGQDAGTPSTQTTNAASQKPDDAQAATGGGGANKAADDPGNGDATSKSDDDMEIVTITGSRLITNGAEAPTPVTAIPVDELQLTTPSNIPDALNKLPAFVSSRNQRTTGGSTINWPANFLNLRSFGTNRTLILFDGIRMPPSDLSNNVDINTMPQALMQRVDVVTGGASAVYGSDAITGVVNFVLDRKFNGLKATMQTGRSTDNDADSYRVGLVGGTSLFGGDGHVEFSFERYNSDGLQNQFVRPYGQLVPMELGGGTVENPYYLATNVRDRNLTAGGYIASGPLADMTFSSNGILSPFVHGAPGAGSLEIGGGGGFAGQSYYLFPGVNANPGLVASLETDQLFGRFDYDFGNVNAYLMSTVSEAKNYNVSYVQNFTATYSSDNAFLPANARALLDDGDATSFTMSKALMNNTGAISDGFTRNFNIIAGVEGSAFGFDWDLHYTHGRTKVRVSSPETLNIQRLYAALDSVTDPEGRVVCRATLTPEGAAAYAGCIPFNAFGPNANDLTAFNYVTDDTQYEHTFGMDDISGSIRGTLFDGWAGPIRAALEVEYRDLFIETHSDYQPTQRVDCTYQNPVTCNPNSAVWNGTVAELEEVPGSVKEAAVELDLPLIKGVPLIDLFSLNLAGRYTDYSSNGSVETWKLGAVWNVTDDFRIRSAISQDIRAPSLNDLFGATGANFSAWYDYVSGQVGQTTIIVPSNPDLTPEVSKTTTAGFVYQPNWASNLAISVDWYDIAIDNSITYVVGGLPTVDQACASGATQFCGLDVRPAPGEFPTGIIVKSINVGKQSTHGIDTEISYNFNIDQLWKSGSGRIDTRLLYSYQPSLLVTAGQPGSLEFNQAGAQGSNGQDTVSINRATFNLSYTNGSFSVGAQERYLSSTKPSFNPDLVYSDPDVPQAFYTDLNLMYGMSAFSGENNLDWFLTVENLFNRQPTLFIGTGRTGAPGYAYAAPFTEDVIGRYFTLGFRLKL